MDSPSRSTRAQASAREQQAASPAKSTRSQPRVNTSPGPAAQSPGRTRKKKTASDLDVWEDADEEILGTFGIGVGHQLFSILTAEFS